MKELIEKYGIENIIFLCPVRPLNNGMGITYTHSNDEPIIPCIIDESRYKVKDNYKISLKPLYVSFETYHFYVNDLHHLLISGDVKMYNQIDKIKS